MCNHYHVDSSLMSEVSLKRATCRFLSEGLKIFMAGKWLESRDWWTVPTPLAKVPETKNIPLSPQTENFPEGKLSYPDERELA